jgi:hypothetical protein
MDTASHTLEMERSMLMSWISIYRRVALGAAAAAALTGAASFPANAQDELVLLETTQAATFINGGVTSEDEAYLRKTAKDWPLRMTFSERKDNEFVADVDLLVTDHRGAPMLALPSAGPMTYARLPAGKYRIAARFHGKTEVRDVTLDGKSGADVYFHWKGKPKVEPWDGKQIGGKQASG